MHSRFLIAARAATCLPNFVRQQVRLSTIVVALLLPRSAAAQRITDDSVVRVQFVAGDSIQYAVGRLVVVTPDSVVLRIGNDGSRITLDRSTVTGVDQRNPRRVGHSAAVGCAVVAVPVLGLGILGAITAHGGDGDAGAVAVVLTTIGTVAGCGAGAVVGALIGLSPGWHQVSISPPPRGVP